MIKFQVVNELCLMITSTGGGEYVFTKAGAFIGGECLGNKNYSFSKVLLGPQANMGQALLGSLARRATGENLPLMKVEFAGESTTYYANNEQHVVVFQLQPGEALFVESENLLAFTAQCSYDVRFMGQGLISQKGMFTTRLAANGPEAFVAVLVDGNPIVLSNEQSGKTIQVDPDAVVCWTNSDPAIKMDTLSWKNLIGQHSGESYMFEWHSGARTTVIIQPNERMHGQHGLID